MAHASPPPGGVEGEQILGALGYKQELNRAVGILGTIALVASSITPTASAAPSSAAKKSSRARSGEGWIS
jgi:hypothetical protein